MDSGTSLQASFWVAILLQTIGAVDPRNGPRKMPSPKAYVAVLIAWAGLQLLADTGRERAASVAGWFFVLVSLVGIPGKSGTGDAGRKLVNFFSSIAKNYSPPNTSGSGGGTVSA